MVSDTKTSKGKDFDVKYKANSYNIFEFLKKHPGGINYVQAYKEKDISQPMELYEHSELAYRLLEEYKKGGKGKGEQRENLEDLVNWDEPMLGQVTKLGTNYYKWVTSPVDRPLRIFRNPFLEFFTNTPWYLVPIMWIPLCIYLIIKGANQYTEIIKDSNPYLPEVLVFATGVIFWSLFEYTMHRWVFHLVPSGHSKAMIYFHFLAHGIHHKVPFDSGRLVFPIVPAAGIAYSVYIGICLVFPKYMQLLLLAGACSGYVVYDMTHFYIHHGSPKENSYFYYLKRYHNYHHFVHQEDEVRLWAMTVARHNPTPDHFQTTTVAIATGALSDFIYV